MGYKPGEGLGRSGEGITAPISEDIHKGRRGLGYILDGLEKEDVHWELEEVRKYYCWCMHSVHMYMYMYVHVGETLVIPIRL